MEDLLVESGREIEDGRVVIGRRAGGGVVGAQCPRRRQGEGRLHPSESVVGAAVPAEAGEPSAPPPPPPRAPAGDPLRVGGASLAIKMCLSRVVVSASTV